MDSQPTTVFELERSAILWRFERFAPKLMIHQESMMKMKSLKRENQMDKDLG